MSHFFACPERPLTPALSPKRREGVLDREIKKNSVLLKDAHWNFGETVGAALCRDSEMIVAALALFDNLRGH